MASRVPFVRAIGRVGCAATLLLAAGLADARLIRIDFAFDEFNLSRGETWDEDDVQVLNVTGGSTTYLPGDLTPGDLSVPYESAPGVFSYNDGFLSGLGFGAGESVTSLTIRENGGIDLVGASGVLGSINALNTAFTSVSPTGSTLPSDEGTVSISAGFVDAQYDSSVQNPNVSTGSDALYADGSFDFRSAIRIHWALTNFDAFQVILIDRSDTGAGNFDMEFNYTGFAAGIGTASFALGPNVLDPFGGPFLETTDYDFAFRGGAWVSDNPFGEPATSVPEPSTWALMLLGLASLFVRARRLS